MMQKKKALEYAKVNASNYKFCVILCLKKIMRYSYLNNATEDDVNKYAENFKLLAEYIK